MAAGVHSDAGLTVSVQGSPHLSEPFYNANPVLFTVTRSGMGTNKQEDPAV